MSGQVSFEWSELTEYTQKLVNECNKNFPGEYDKFLKSEARKVRKSIGEKSADRLNEITGNYLKSAKVGKLYDYGGTRSIRTYASSKAHHAHLIEKGHAISAHKKDKLKPRKPDPNSAKRKAAKSTYAKIGMGGKTRAFGSYELTRLNEKAVFEANFEKFYDKLLKKAGLV